MGNGNPDRYGSGDYSIRLNDTHPKVNATVCQTWIRDLRDLDQYPPVLDIDQIVLSDPSNASYIRWRQTNNLPMPRGVDNPEDPESMGTAAVKEMASLVQDQNKQIIELTKAAAKPAEDSRHAASRGRQDRYRHHGRRHARVNPAGRRQLPAGLRGYGQGARPHRVFREGHDDRR